MKKKNGTTIKNMTIMKDMTTKDTRGRETIPREGIKQEPSPVLANLLQSSYLNAVLLSLIHI